MTNKNFVTLLGLLGALSVPAAWSADAGMGKGQGGVAESITKQIVQPKAGEPVFEIRLAWQKDEEERGEVIKRVDIVRKDAGKKIQSFKVLGLHDGECECHFGLVDANFDGYLDFWLIYSVGATGNAFQSFWLYDPKTKEFKKDEQLEKLSLPNFDARKQIVTSHHIEGCAGQQFSNGVYRYAGAKLVRIRVEEQSCTENGVEYEVRELREGKMVTIYKGKPPE